MNLVINLCILAMLNLVKSNQIVADQNQSEFGRAFAKNCDSAYTFTCFKLDIVSWVDKINESGDFHVIPGVSIVREHVPYQNTADIVANLAREYPDDPEVRLDEFLIRKVSSFANNHAIKFKLNWNEEGVGARKGGGGLGGGKGGGGYGYLLAAGAMLKGTLFAVGMAALAALAGKALMLSMMSLLLSAMKGHGGGGKTTYEVIAKPVHTHSSSHSESHEGYHHGGHSGYGRSFDEPLVKSLQSSYRPPYQELGSY